MACLYNMDVDIIQSKIKKYFLENDVDFYTCSVGDYLKNFKRDSFGCVSFYSKDHSHKYYVYFNAIYFKDDTLNHSKLSSVSIVDNSDLSTGTYKPISKIHIDCIDDLNEVLKEIKTLL